MTEEEWKKIIKKEGCAFNPLWKTKGEYANLPMYIRLYISLLAKKEVFDDKGEHLEGEIAKILEEYSIKESAYDVAFFIMKRLREKHHLSTSKKEAT